MDEQIYVITFDTTSAADANRYAEELRQTLLDASPDVQVHRRRDNPHTQDIGATLVLLLGTPATVAIVTAIGNWLALRNRASITIKRADEQIVIQNITSKRAADLADLLLKKQ
jgi:Effector Associated Constant Component 1